MKNKRKMKSLKRYRNPYLFISPFFLLFIVFQLFPMVWSLFISFTEWNGMGQARQVGLNNYRVMFRDYIFWDAVGNTFFYWATAVIFILPAALLMALLLNYGGLRSRNFFKAMTFFPYVCAAVAVGLIFNMMFDHNAGIINELLKSFGLSSIPWLTSTRWSRVPVVILNVWRNTPWFSMILLSGLLTIPTDYYESATIDGAGAFQQFWRITLPSLGNLLFFCFIILTVDSWKIFSEPFILKGPGTSNIALFQYMYENSFTLFKFGYAAAIGYVLTIILLILSVVQFALMKNQGEV